MLKEPLQKRLCSKAFLSLSPVSCLAWYSARSHSADPFTTESPVISHLKAKERTADAWIMPLPGLPAGFQPPSRATDFLSVACPEHLHQRQPRLCGVSTFGRDQMDRR